MSEIAKTIPAYNPADANTLDGLNNVFLNKIMMNVDCVIPGIVQSYNKTTNRAVIKPAITGVASQGQKISKEPYIDIPVYMPSAGDCIIAFPIQAGQTGWLIACDRNISIFKQNMSESAPNDYRKHKFEDAFFLPDAINHTGVDNLKITNGTQTLEMTSSQITATDFKALNGATGSFSIDKPKATVTVENGIITAITAN